MESINSGENWDFSRARTRQFLRAVWGVLSGRQRALLSWDEVRDSLKLRGTIARGLQTVPIDRIVGSVGRYQDFDDAFLPKRNELGGRWRSIDRAFYSDVSLPPVELYQVGDAYFVLDGNHRVSVARERGAAFIDAEVYEAMTPVPVTTDLLNAEHLHVLGEYSEFLERTRLEQIRPGQTILFSIAGGYQRLIEHIAVHRYFMGLEQKRDISEDEAVADWYDQVYLPVVSAIREEEVLAHFPGRTEADLYVWVIEHQFYLSEACGCEVSPEAAAADFEEQYGARSPIQRAVQAVEQVVDAITGRGETDAPNPGQPAIG